MVMADFLRGRLCARGTGVGGRVCRSATGGGTDLKIDGAQAEQDRFPHFLGFVCPVRANLLGERQAVDSGGWYTDFL